MGSVVELLLSMCEAQGLILREGGVLRKKEGWGAKDRGGRKRGKGCEREMEEESNSNRELIYLVLGL